jgi:hypothetical protein
MRDEAAAGIRGARILLRRAANLHLRFGVIRAHPEDRAGPTLTLQAVAGHDAARLSLGFHLHGAA